MEKKAARSFFIWGTVICTAIFIWLTIDTHSTIPKRTNTDQLTEEVVLGKRVWHKYNCNDCHTILGKGTGFSHRLKIQNPIIQILKCQPTLNFQTMKFRQS